MNSMEFVKDCATNWDCDTGANGSHPFYCRKCNAQKILEQEVEQVEVPEWVKAEIRDTWNAARKSGGQMEAFRILERMVDRLGYGRREDNPSLKDGGE